MWMQIGLFAITAVVVTLYSPVISAQETPVDVETPVTTSLEGMLLILNKAEASVSVIDLAKNQEVARIEVGDGPHEVAVAPDESIAVVCNYGQRTPGNTLSVIDLATYEVTKTIDLGEHHRPHGIVFLDNNRIAVTNEQEQNLLLVNVPTGVIETVLPTNARISHMVAVTPDKSIAYVTNIGSGSVSIFDLTQGRHIQTVATGEGAEGVDISPDGKEVWVTNRAAETLSVLNTATSEIIETIACESFPIRVKFTPDGSKVLVSNARTGDVVVFDAASHAIIRRIVMNEPVVDDDAGRLFAGSFEGSPTPVGILIPPAGTHAFVANTQADVVTIIHLESLRIVGRLATGKEPDGLGFFRKKNAR
ncbi:MAG: cytochrome D1 domain-containing protein [Phycisphaerales bacterium]